MVSSVQSVNSMQFPANQNLEPKLARQQPAAEHDSDSVQISAAARQAISGVPEAGEGGED